MTDTDTQGKKTERRSIRAVLVEDHTLVRDGIRALLEELGSVVVVAEAADGFGGLKLAKRLRPDVVISDIRLPKMNGYELARRLRAECPDVPVIALSMHHQEDYVMRALRNGMRGYVTKDAGLEELSIAIEAVLRGESYLTPSVTNFLIQRALEADVVESHPIDRLSDRQREVLQHLVEGKNVQEIAKIMCLSPKTVNTHRAELMKKLSIDSLPDLVRFAVNAGLVPA